MIAEFKPTLHHIEFFDEPPVLIMQGLTILSAKLAVNEKRCVFSKLARRD
jgi:hypothetical protein